ncbi:MAG TPA: HAD family hydrolase [Gemmatimonadales bacterium]
MSHGAVFLDRDGTIIADPGYLHEPTKVVLLPHAAEGLAEISAAGWPLVIISNQSGIARGFYGADAFQATMQRLEELLEPWKVSFADVRFCPHHPQITGPCECRKPGTQLFRESAAEHEFDLAGSWYVGDRWRDAQPATELGGHGLLVTPHATDKEAGHARREGAAVVPDLLAAARLIGEPQS